MVLLGLRKGWPGAEPRSKGSTSTLHSAFIGAIFICLSPHMIGNVSALPIAFASDRRYPNLQTRARKIEHCASIGLLRRNRPLVSPDTSSLQIRFETRCIRLRTPPWNGPSEDIHINFEARHSFDCQNLSSQAVGIVCCLEC